MTVLPFSRRAPGASRRTTAPPVAVVHGSFGSPSGGTGSFSGTYRLEHLVARAGRLAASGVYTGELSDERGRRVGVAARRRTVPVALTAVDGHLRVHLAARDVDLNGLIVAVDELVVEVAGTSAERAVRAGLCLPPPEEDSAAGGSR